MSVAERLVAEGKASPELAAAYGELLALRGVAAEGGELPKKPPEFVVKHKEHVRRMQTRERVRRHREKKCNAENTNTSKTALQSNHLQTQNNTPSAARNKPRNEHD